MLTPHASLERRRFFEPSAQYGGTNEGVRGEYSGSWLAFLPAFTTAFDTAIGLHREVVSSYSSATASGFHGIPRIHTHRYKSRKELGRICGGNGENVKIGENWSLRIVDLKKIWQPIRVPLSGLVGETKQLQH